MLAVEGPAGPAILKVMDPSHRSPDEAQAEVDWLLALREAGVRVARPLATRDGAWLALEGDPPTVAVAYARAPGRHLEPDAWTPALFRAHGELVGRLQAHARGWTPPGPRRAGWRDHHALERAPEALPDDAAFLEAVAEVAARVDAHVPQRPEDVGLVHADLHAWNLLVDDAGALTAIDFDDAVVGPYLYDLVIPLYYAVATRLDRDPGEAADAFLTPYLEGFDAVAPRPPAAPTRWRPSSRCARPTWRSSCAWTCPRSAGTTTCGPRRSACATARRRATRWCRTTCCGGTSEAEPRQGARSAAGTPSRKDRAGRLLRVAHP